MATRDELFPNAKKYLESNFDNDLAYSQSMSDAEFWDAIYRKAFPNLVNHMTCEGNVPSQRMGIDRVILLSNGQKLAIDEKKRRGEWNDILLEYISVSTTGAPGWIEKDLAIDYLAYAFMISKRCYLLPWPMLRRAWKLSGKGWVQLGERDQDGFHKISASNPEYETISVAVPIAVLLKSIAGAAIIQL